MVMCTYCNGTGANHYDDNNPCGICDASGVVEEVETAQQGVQRIGLWAWLKLWWLAQFANR